MEIYFYIIVLSVLTDFLLSEGPRLDVYIIFNFSLDGSVVHSPGDF